MRQTPSILRALRLLGFDGSDEAQGTELTPYESAWLSGYFAGLARARGTTAAAEEQAAHAQQRALGTPAPERICVLYGSETGNAAGLARGLAERLRSLDAAVEVADLAAYKPRSLERERTVVVITSTHGDGAPPEPARRFFEALEGPLAPKSLRELRFAVLGLGDSSYEHFCRAAKLLDERLAALGATRLLERVDCDLDFESPAAKWLDELLTRIDLRSGAASRLDPLQPGDVTARAASVAPSYDRKRPFLATVLENQPLTGRGSSKETRHLALSLEGSGLEYLPGDALGICAPNDPALVDALIGTLGWSGSDPVVVDGHGIPLREALLARFDVCIASPRFLRAWAEASGAAPLLALVPEQADAERRNFLRAHHLLDIVERYPVRSLAAETFVQWLRPLTPRLYSIASSRAAAPDEVHLTIGVVRYAQNGRARTGVASGHVAERVREGEALSVYVHPNACFRLPADPATPILMIGAGTGVAPFRAFVQERATAGARGRSWLFFGERNFRTDFLYQTEWQAFLREQSLSKLTLAFSRDQASKVYVQDRLREHAREVHAWLEDGAHVYVCGDAQALAPAVHEALLTIIQEHAGSRERAVERLQALADAGRYQRDVY
jgi:sulfite reductase (NADPH) flavoprotein alpha-component